MNAGGSPGPAPDLEDFRHQVEQLFQLKLSARQQEQFSLFEQLLLEWNQRVNLTAIRDVPGIRTKHFLDSLSLFQFIPSAGTSSIVDIGSGAGFPGLPLKILNPGLRLVLVDSIGKKTSFCRLAVETLGLSEVVVVTGRAEELSRMEAHRERYDFAVARAVAALPTLLEYLLPLVRLGGCMLAQKGTGAHHEAHRSEEALRLLGGTLERVQPVVLPGVSDERYIVQVRKVAATPGRFPRPSGQPQKRPLGG